MSQSSNTPMQKRTKRDRTDFAKDARIETARVHDEVSQRTSVFNTRELPTPRNTRRLLSKHNHPSPMSRPPHFDYSVNIQPLNLPTEPSPPRATYAGQHFRRSSLGANKYTQPLASTSRTPSTHNEPSTSNTPSTSLPSQIRFESPPHPSQGPRRHSDEVLPSYRLRAAQWNNTPSPAPSADVESTSTPPLSDAPTMTPSPNIPPYIPTHAPLRGDTGPSTLVHRWIRSSYRVPPYPNPVAPPTVAVAAEEVLEAGTRRKRPRTVKQRIRWVPVAPGIPPTTSAIRAAAAAMLPQYPHHPPSRPPQTRTSSAASRPWMDAQIKLDLSLIEPPSVPITIRPQSQFEGGSSFVSSQSLQGDSVQPRQMSLPPIATLEAEAGPDMSRQSRREIGNKRAGGGKGKVRKGKDKERQTVGSSEVNMDFEIDGWSTYGANQEWWRGTKKGGKDDEDVEMLVDDRDPRRSSEEAPRMRLPQAVRETGDTTQSNMRARTVGFASNVGETSARGRVSTSTTISGKLVKQEAAVGEESNSAHEAEDIKEE